MEHRIGLEEMAQRLADLVREAEGGDSVVFTRGGTPVAKLVPVTQASVSKVGDPESDAAFARLMAKLEKGYDLGIKKFNRDEAYERHDRHER